MLVFTDDYSSTIFVYFLKAKSDTAKATGRFFADVAPHGSVKCLELFSCEFCTIVSSQTLLNKNSIKHESSAPYSPHQNGTAERNCRTLFDMARYMLIESNLPKELWTYAVMTAAAIRTRCFNDRMKATPFFMLTRKKPNLSRMRIFDSTCFAYGHDKKKLDLRCDKGIFVGYDKNSPSYLVYYADTKKVMKHRLVKFVTKNVVEHETQTDQTITGDDVDKRRDESSMSSTDMTDQSEKDREISQTETSDNQHIQIEGGGCESRYPKRDRKPPLYLSDYVSEISDQILTDNKDYCYRMYDVPQTFKDAISSSNSDAWTKAMKEEMDFLKENDTFTLTRLPEGKHAVGGRWVYAVKDNADETKTYKARYVAKG